MPLITVATLLFALGLQVATSAPSGASASAPDVAIDSFNLEASATSYASG